MVISNQITNVRFGNNLYTGSINELNFTAGVTPGTGQQNKALVLDGYNDIDNINHITSNKLTTGELIVTGVTSNLNTNGVIVRAYSSDGLRGRMIKKDIIPEINLTNYDPLGQIDYYSLEIIGYIKPLYTEAYTFKITANDKIRFWINNKLLYNNWINSNLVDVATDSISLEANIYYPIYIQTSEYTGIQTLTIKWQSTSQVLQIIPSSKLAWDDRLPCINTEQFIGDSLNIYSANSIVGYKTSQLLTNSAGELIISSTSKIISIDTLHNFEIKSHNGVSTGLVLSGELVKASAFELNYLSGITIGQATQYKSLVLNGSKDISGINILNATSLGGTLTTISQPNITSIGTLTSLISSGQIIFNSTTSSINSTTGSVKIAGSVAISNITDAVSIYNGGTFTSAGGGAFAKTLYVGGNLITNDITGTLLTNEQPNITSVGTLTELTLSGTISGITTLTATTVNSTNISGTITTASQPNITSLGTLTSLILSGNLSGVNVLTANTINGTLITIAQPNITSVGTLTSLSTIGLIDSSLTTSSTNSTTGAVKLLGGISIANNTDAISSTNGGTFTSAGGGAFAKKLFVGTTLTAANLVGILNTAAQPNITSLGTLTSLTLSGTITGITTLTATTVQSTNLSGTLSTASQPNITSLGTLTSLTLSGTISGVSTLTATTLAGTLSTVAQPNITSIGTLTGLNTSGIINSTLTTASTNSTTGSLKLAGGLAISNTTDAISEFNGGSFTSAGGGAFAKSLYIGNNLTVNGNLSVLGTTTTFNTSIIEMEDNTLLLNNGPSGTGFDSGIQIKRYQNDNIIGDGDVVADSVAENYALSAVTSTTITLPAGANTTNNYYNNWWIKITNGTAINQVRQITAYVGSTKVATLSSAFSITPSIGNNVNLYNKVYTTMVWNESNKCFKIAYTSSSSNSTVININNNVDFECNNLNLTSTTNSTNNTTGALKLAGGIGISNTTDVISNTNGGSFTSAGGGAFAKSLYVGGNLFTNNITGTLSTAAQPNITSVGTLTSLTLSGFISGVTTLTATTLAGTLSTVSQPNITSVGTLTGLNLSGNLISSSTTNSTSEITGSLQLSGGIGIANTTDATNITNGGTFTSAGGGAFAKSLFIGGDLTTNNITGTLITTSQPNITNVGTLNSLSLNGILNSILSTTSTSSNAGSVVLAGGLSISNNTDATSNTNGGTFTSAGGGAFAKSLYVGGNLITNNITGTLLTNAQPNITSVGTLASLNVTGLLTSGTFNATNLGGILTTAAQTNITSLGTLTSLTTSGLFTSTLNTTSVNSSTGSVKLAGGIAISHTTDAVSSLNGGTFTSAGGGAFAKSLYVGGDLITNNITGTLLTNAQPNITTLGTLIELYMAGPITGITTLTAVNMIATNITGTLISSSQPNITSIGTLSNLIVNGDITGVDDLITNKVLATSITGTLLTSVQPNITSLGTLTSLTLSGTISGVTTLTATTIAGTLSTTSQPNITSLGTLTSLTLSGAITGVTTLTATTLAGTLSTPAQPNITSIGTLTNINTSGIINSTLTTAATNSTTGALKLVGGLAIANTTEAISEFNGGSFTSAGGGAFAKSLFVGLDLTVGGNVNILGTTNTINSTVTEINDNTLLLNNGPSGTGYDSGILIKRYQNNNIIGDGDVVADDLTENYAISAVTSTTITLPAGANATNNYYNNWWIKITNGAAINQVRQISTYNGSTKVATLSSAFGTIPSIGNNVNLYSRVLSAIIWNESNKRFTTCFSDSSYNTTMVDIIDNTDFECEKLYVNSTANSTSSSMGALQVSGGISISNGTDATNNTNGGSFTSAGGGAFAKTVYIGGDLITNNITGVITTQAQPNITSIGSLSSLNVTGSLTVGSFSSVNLGGTLTTAAQPNITSVGTLTNLNISGTLTAGTFNTTNFSGTVITPAQPYITSLGTLNNLTVSGTLTVGSFNAINLGGTLTTQNQPNITSIGTLSSLNVSGNLTAGSFTINTLNVTNFGGTISTAAQPYITSVGTLTNLNLSGPISGVTTLTATAIIGTLSTVAQPNITSIGTLTSLNTSGINTFTNTTTSTSSTIGALKLSGGISLSNTTDAISSTNGGTFTSAGGGSFAKKLFVGTTLTATTLVGTISTAAQPNITSVGTLSSLTLSGAISGITTLTASSLVGTLSTVSQPNITSIGTLTGLNITGIINSTLTTASTDSTTGALKLAGGLAISNTTDALDEFNGGSFTSAGGGAFAKSLYVGDNLLVSGDLIINGTTTTINSNIMTLADNIILLNAGPTGVNADTGFLSERYQTANESGYGDIVNNSPPSETYNIIIATLTTITLPFGSSSTTNYYKNWWVKIGSGTANNNVRRILSYNNTTRQITLETAFSVLPQPGDIIYLYNRVYGACFYNESNQRYVIGYTASDANSSFVNIYDYADVAINKMISYSTEISSAADAGGIVLYGGIGISNTTNATSITNGGSFTSAGGGAFAKSVFIGQTLTATTLAGTLSTAAQPNITSVGTLSSLTLAGTLSGVTTLTATTLAGILSTIAQPNITSVGSLTGLTVNGNITVTGTVNGRDISNDATTFNNHIANTSNPHNTTIDHVTPTTTKGDILVENGTNMVRLPVGANDTVLVADSTQANGIKWSLPPTIKYAVIRDVKIAGTNGGTANANIWETRTLNTLNDPSAIVSSLATNQFTLSAGNYYISVNAPVYRVGLHQIRLWNATTSTVTTYGQSSQGEFGDSATLDIALTITVSTIFRIQHRTSGGEATIGYGYANNFGGDEVYTVVNITKY